MAFVVDRFQPTDFAAGLRLSTQAGWNQVAADWQRVLDLCPDAFFAGRLDGRVVATGCAATYGAGAAWIGLILVDEELRGRGYGGIMFDRALERAREIVGDAVGLDASPFGRPVYLKKGFVDVAPIDRWGGVLRRPDRAPALGAVTSSTFDRVAALDREACGVDRSALLRHLMGDGAAAGFVLPDEGHAFLYPGRLHAHLGPVVATSDAAFAALLDQAAQRLEGAELVTDVIRTPSSSALLESRGLRITRELTRMTVSRPQPLLSGPSIRAAVSFTWG
jgi:GNAT superfamily N-acetyltransferase